MASQGKAGETTSKQNARLVQRNNDCVPEKGATKQHRKWPGNSNYTQAGQRNNSQAHFPQRPDIIQETVNTDSETNKDLPDEAHQEIHHNEDTQEIEMRHNERDTEGPVTQEKRYWYGIIKPTKRRKESQEESWNRKFAIATQVEGSAKLLYEEPTGKHELSFGNVTNCRGCDVYSPSPEAILWS